MQYLQITTKLLQQFGFSIPAQANSFFPKNDPNNHIRLGLATSFQDEEKQQQFAEDDAYFLRFVTLIEGDKILVRLLHDPSTGTFSFPQNFDTSQIPSEWLKALIDIGAITPQEDLDLFKKIEKQLAESQPPPSSTSNRTQGNGMMDFEGFLAAINNAVHGAADMVKNKNIALLNEYFEPSDTPFLLSADGKHNVPALTPKRAVFEFPVNSDDGPSYHTVQAPLISLVPMSQFQIKEVKVTSEMEIGVENEQIRLGVASGTGSGSTAKIEVIIESTDPVGGYVEITNGYNRALRAQIPG